MLHRPTIVETNEGPLSIEDIVENRREVRVLTWNQRTNCIDYRPITDWLTLDRVQYTDWIDVVPQVGSHVRCTRSQQVLTDSGWVKASKLDPKTQKILVNQHDKYWLGLVSGTLLGDTWLSIEKRGKGRAYRLGFQHTNKNLFDAKVKLLALRGKERDIVTGFGSDGWRFMSESLTLSVFPVKKFYFVGHSDRVGQRKVVPYHHGLDRLLTPEALSLWIADDGGIVNNNGNAFTPRLTLNTHGHSDAQLSEFVKFFKRKWDSIPSLSRDKRVKVDETQSGKALVFSTKDTLFILNQLRSKQVPGVEYKFYFPTEGYVESAKKGCHWTKFHVRNGRQMPYATRYGIDVAGSDNIVANGIVVHTGAKA